MVKGNGDYPENQIWSVLIPEGEWIVNTMLEAYLQWDVVEKIGNAVCRKTGYQNIG